MSGTQDKPRIGLTGSGRVGLGDNVLFGLRLALLPGPCVCVCGGGGLSRAPVGVCSVAECTGCGQADAWPGGARWNFRGLFPLTHRYVTQLKERRKHGANTRFDRFPIFPWSGL